MSTSKPRFKTAYGERERYFIEPGNGIMNEYGYEIDKFGRKILVKTGETNLYAKIQEALEETKIENILKRVSIGDMSDFRPDGIYQDVTEVPNNMIEAMQQIQEMENTWAKLPNELKAKYNYSVEEFIGASGTDRWLKDMGLISDPTPSESETTAPAENTKGDEANE